MMTIHHFAPSPEDGPDAAAAFKHFVQWWERENTAYAEHIADPTDHAKFKAYRHAEGMTAETLGLYFDELRDARTHQLDASTKPAA